jgi:hypothetical protein
MEAPTRFAGVFFAQGDPVAGPTRPAASGGCLWWKKFCQTNREQVATRRIMIYVLGCTQSPCGLGGLPQKKAPGPLFM